VNQGRSLAEPVAREKVRVQRNSAGTLGVRIVSEVNRRAVKKTVDFRGGL
jgi:hypothetical protein